MSTQLTSGVLRKGLIIACALPLLMSLPVIAADHDDQSRILPNDVLGLMLAGDSSQENAGSFQLSREGQSSGLDFSLSGSETKKLQLQLDQPLTLNMGSQARVMESGTNLMGLNATLNAPIGNGFSLTAGGGKQLGKSQFQSLGSIQCMNGTLRSDSYTASGCRFVDEPYATSEFQQFKIGTQYQNRNTAFSLNWYSQETTLSQPGVSQLNPSGAANMQSDLRLSPGLSNPLLSPATGDPMQHFAAESSGIDLNFQLGITTDNTGDIRLGLAFSRILEANYQGIYSNSNDPLSWTLAEPFNAARMNIEWTSGAFSSGIQGYYRDPVNFLDRSSMDSLTTFDVHFTWRTPWNANLSVGASNVLNAGSDDPGIAENQPVDPLESIYGRIPYVRYKQDL